MKINIALALTSAVFLMVWVTSFVSAIFRFMPVTTSDPAMSDLLASGLLFIAIIELLSIISFSGSVLFLLEARQILSRWYLGVPLCVFMFLLVIVNLLIYSGGKPFLVDPINMAEALWIIVLALLSPCSVLLFLSLYGHNSLTKVYVAVSSAAGIFSVFFLFFVIIEISRWASIEAVILPLAFYWTVLMPAIGVCFLSKATMDREDDDADEESSMSFSGEF